MSNIKKQYQDIVALLEDNQNKKVSSILPQILELVTAKQSNKNFIKDENGKVVSVFCYYHKEWEDVSEVEYGAKASSATGLNSMCKEGVRQWTKQQRDAKKAKEELLAKVANGEVPADQLQEELAKIEDARQAVVAREA